MKFVSGTNAGLNLGNVPDPTVGANPNQAVVPDFSMSTNFQSTSPYIGLYQGTNYATLLDQKVAAIPMKFLGSKGYPGDNLTTQRVAIALHHGCLAFGSVHGQQCSPEQDCLCDGAQYRRRTALRTTHREQSELPHDGRAFQAGYLWSGLRGGWLRGWWHGTSHDLWPVETVSGVSSEFPGNSGASSGANLAPSLTATLSANAYTYGGNFPDATGGYYISYLTTGDSTRSPSRMARWS